MGPRRSSSPKPRERAAPPLSTASPGPDGRLLPSPPPRDGGTCRGTAAARASPDRRGLMCSLAVPGCTSPATFGANVKVPGRPRTASTGPDGPLPSTPRDRGSCSGTAAARASPDRRESMCSLAMPGCTSPASFGANVKVPGRPRSASAGPDGPLSSPADGGRWRSCAAARAALSAGERAASRGFCTPWAKRPESGAIGSPPGCADGAKPLGEAGSPPRVSMGRMGGRWAARGVPSRMGRPASAGGLLGPSPAAGSACTGSAGPPDAAETRGGVPWPSRCTEPLLRRP